MEKHTRPEAKIPAGSQEQRKYAMDKYQENICLLSCLIRAWSDKLACLNEDHHEYSGQVHGRE